MKIFFVTAYDEQTHANLRIANGIVEQTDTFLSEEHATREELHRCMMENKYREIMIMSHGDDGVVEDNNKGYAISEDDCEIFKEVKIYIWACNTGRRLGSLMSNYNSICWGYNNPVTAPSSNNEHDVFFIPLFKEIKNIFSHGNDENSILDIINKIKDKCDQTLEMIDDYDELNEMDDIISLYSCCNNVWSNLIVWHESKKIQHPLAFKYLDI